MSNPHVDAAFREILAGVCPPKRGIETAVAGDGFLFDGCTWHHYVDSDENLASVLKRLHAVLVAYDAALADPQVKIPTPLHCAIEALRR